MKTVCIYHSIDLDGWMSAAIVKYWFESINDYPDNVGKGTIDFIGFNYGDPIPDLSGYDKVIMCDVGFPVEEMIKLYDTKDFIWLDHHISAIKSIALNIKFDKDEPQIEGIRDTKYAACELTWEYYFPDKPMPEIVRLLGRYDCFGHKGTDEEQKVLEFQYGARAVISDMSDAYLYLVLSIPVGIGLNSTTISDIHRDGKAIYKFLCIDAKQSYKNGFPIQFKYDIDEKENVGRIAKFICINKERFNPINFGIKYHDEDYDGAACFHYANGAYNFSLYNDNGQVDCSVIAKQFGGGGHSGASGMRLNHEQFIKLIQ